MDLVQAYKKREYDEDLKYLKDFGGVDSFIEKLNTNLDTGLTGADFPERTEHFGNNYREPLVCKPFCIIFRDALDDFMLKLLIVCASFSITFDMILASPEDRSHAWIEGCAIFVAVFLVASIGSFVDYKKEVQFVKSRLKSEEKNVVRCMRNGKIEVIHNNFLHVGDIIYVEYGMAIPVDGICLQAVQLMADEAAMTGESDEVKKEPLAKCLSYQREKEMDTNKTTTVKITRAHDLPSPIMMSGSSISGGEGKMVSIMVGDDSSIGQIMKITRKAAPEVTPLQHKLE